MSRIISRFILPAFLIMVSLVAFNRCGNDWCIAGIGPCDNIPNFDPNNTSGGGLRLEADPSTSIQTSSTVTVTAKGGTTPYSFSLQNKSNSGNVDLSGVTATTAQWVAPAAVPSEGARIRVTDDEGDFAEIIINVYKP